MIRASLFAALAAFADASVCSDRSYLGVTLWDSFGDGWDTAMWRINDPDGNSAESAPSCDDADTMMIDPCDFPEYGNGNFSMTVSTLDSSMPMGSWEIYWKVEVFDYMGDPTGTYLEGGYGTSMVWNYDNATDAWTLVNSDNVPSNDCITCSGNKCSKSKPKNDKKKSNKSKPSSHGTNTTAEEETGYSYGSPDTTVRVKMHADSEDGWSNVSPIGARWVISDVTNTEMFETGSLCSKNKGECSVCLGDGTYIFRATSEVVNNSSETSPRKLRKTGPGGDSMDTNSTISEDSNSTDGGKAAPSPRKRGGKRGGKNGPRGDTADTNSTADEVLRHGPDLDEDTNSTISEDSNSTDGGKAAPSPRKRGGKNGPRGDTADTNSTISEDSNSTRGDSAGKLSPRKRGGKRGKDALLHMVGTNGTSHKSKPGPKPRREHDNWEFCHASGSFGDELTFHIKNGKCYPDVLTWAGETCDPEVSSRVALLGSVALDGIDASFINSADYAIVLSNLAKTVSGWDMSEMEVKSLSVPLSAGATRYLQFTVSFVAENFDVDGTLYAAAVALVDDMAATLQTSFASGSFVSMLHSSAVTSGAVSLSEVSNAELVSLEILSITYSNNRLVYYYGEDSAVSSSSGGMSVGVIVLFVAVVAIAGVAVAGMLAHSFNSYERVSSSTDSEVSEKVRLGGLKSKFGLKFEKLPMDSEAQVSPEGSRI